MAAPPTFFLSYARGDAEEGPKDLVAQFFKDLEREVARLAGLDPRANRLGMLDLGLDQGVDWKRQLGKALMTHHVFVALLSPLYFNRETCGRELGAFLRRYPPPYTDAQGGLLEIENILPIRWMGEKAFCVNGAPDAVVPPLLRSVEWRPASRGGDPELDAAVKRYIRRGMEGCVKPGREYYKILIDYFANRIREMPNLPARDDEPDLVNGESAYTAAWLQPTAPQPPAGALLAEPPPGPRTLAALYVTAADLPPDPRAVGFADILLCDANAAAQPDWLSLLIGAVTLAAADEDLDTYQGVVRPGDPSEPHPSRLAQKLASLSAKNVLTILLIDPALWPTSNAPQIAAVLRDPTWTGAAAMPMPAKAASRRMLEASLMRWNANEGRERPVVALPTDPGMMEARLRSLFVANRGVIMRAGTPTVAASNRPLPTVRGVGPT
jgi:hypothetical protein